MTDNHASDCAIHNAPTYSSEDCNCNVSLTERLLTLDPKCREAAKRIAAMEIEIRELRQRLLEKHITNTQ